MDSKGENSLKHKEWRRLAKKERRRRLRRKAAQERDADDQRLRATLERSADYKNWLAEQEKLDEEREAFELREHEEKERLWLEEEVRAQKEWKIVQERKAKARQEKIQQEEKIRKEFEAKQETLRKKKEETKRLYEEEVRKHEDIQKQIDEYINNDAKTPEALRAVSESQAGKELCPFFTKTGACRYGDSCSRNHRRVALSRVILVPGFYTHFSLEKNSAEYDTDVSLEFESSEMRRHFREFYDEVVPELEKFGRIKTLKYCCNTEIHLRGNLYVEYRTEREAARAWRKLKGRYWSGRQLNCEFVNLNSWRDAVCGMTKCPKGRACNFLHTIRNPNDEYDIKSPPRWRKKKETHEGSVSRRSGQGMTSKWDEIDRMSTDESRNWRWSESPESKKNEDDRWSIDSRSERRSSSRSKRRQGDSERSRSRKSVNDVERHKESSRSRRTEERYMEDGDSKCEKRSLRKRDKKSRKRQSDHETKDNGEEVEEKDCKKCKVSESSRQINRSDYKRKSRDKSRTREEEFDENFDTNSTPSRASVKSLETEEDGKIVKASKARWDEVESTPKQDVEELSMKKRIFSAEGNTWDTTDSESEGK